MNMSLYELYIWLAGLDFPSVSAIWTWLITVPWWLAIFTVVFIIFAVRLSWALAASFFSWLSEWMFDTGGWVSEKALEVKRLTSMTIQFCRSVKKSLFR